MPRKHLLTLVACAAWLGMAGALVRRHAAPTAGPVDMLPALTTAAVDSDAGEEWFGVYRGEHKIGYTVRRVEVAGDRRRLTDRSSMSFAMLGTPQTVRMDLVADVNERWELERFQFQLTSEAAMLNASGAREGDRLRVRYGFGDREEHADLPWTEPIALAGGLRPRIVAAWPAPGTRYAHAVLNPLTMRSETVETVVDGADDVGGVEALRLVERHGGLEVRAWLDREGRVLREESVLGFVLVREPRAVALAGREDAAPVEMTSLARIPLDGAIADPRERGELVLDVSGPAMALVPDDPPRQRREGRALRITRESMPSRVAPGTTDAAVTGFVAPSPFIESDDAAIVETARMIVGTATDPVDRARRLVAWVRRNVEQRPSVTMPSARQVLAARRGDCNEHAVLLAALARAAGIPARVVAGAVFLDGGFYYHAWNELWLGRWVSADAIFAQMPADVTHVKLIEGGPERHFELAGVLDRLRFRVVEEDT